LTSISAMQVFRIGAAAVAAHGRAVDVISNNMANVSTTAFDRSRVEFRELLQEETGVEAAGVDVSAVRRICPQGVIRVTGRLLDVAIGGRDCSRYSFRMAVSVTGGTELSRETPMGGWSRRMATRCCPVW